MADDGADGVVMGERVSNFLHELSGGTVRLLPGELEEVRYRSASEKGRDEGGQRERGSGPWGRDDF